MLLIIVLNRYCDFDDVSNHSLTLRNDVGCRIITFVCLQFTITNAWYKLLHAKLPITVQSRFQKRFEKPAAVGRWLKLINLELTSRYLSCVLFGTTHPPYPLKSISGPPGQPLMYNICICMDSHWGGGGGKRRTCLPRII